MVDRIIEEGLYVVTEDRAQAVMRFMECVWAEGGGLCLENEPIRKESLPELIRQWAEMEAG